jgi:hypothetical protein
MSGNTSIIESPLLAGPKPHPDKDPHSTLYALSDMCRYFAESHGRPLFEFVEPVEQCPTFDDPAREIPVLVRQARLDRKPKPGARIDVQRQAMGELNDEPCVISSPTVIGALGAATCSDQESSSVLASAMAESPLIGSIGPSAAAH